MVPRPKLFVLVRRAKATTPKTVWGLSPGEDVFCTLETNDGRRHIRPALCFGEKITGKDTITMRKVSWV
jgi:hypothetical protein